MKKLGQYSDYVPVALIIVGFTLIGVAWNGAASVDYVQGQIPYLISGGLSGLAMVFFGLTSMLLRAVKEAQSRQETQLDNLVESVNKLGSVLSLSGNGASRDDSHLVVAGSASFHLVSCRMVGDQATVKLPRDEAEAKGLEPCRICNP